MTPDEIKAAYKASLETIATLTSAKDVAEKAYGAACEELGVATAENLVLKTQLDACIAAGTI